MKAKGIEHHKPVQQYVCNNVALDRKLKQAFSDLKAGDQHLLLHLPTDEDKELLADFVLKWSEDYGHGKMMSVHTKRAYVTALVYLSRWCGARGRDSGSGGTVGKSFKDITLEDIINAYLKSISKDFPSDPDERWVNTYRVRARNIIAFYKWYTQPDLKPEERQTPPQVKGAEAATSEAKDIRKA